MELDLDFDSLSLTEMIRLQDQISKVVTRRFERHIALAFTDVVESTSYFSKYGDEAGRGLQQRHNDMLQSVLPKANGRIVDTAGDGAFIVFDDLEAGVEALIELQKSLAKDNAARLRDHELVIRTGIHWGPVLTDGQLVTGDSVNLCARVASSAEPGEIRLTQDAFRELSNMNRLRCRPTGPVKMKGIPRPLELVTLEWQDASQFPSFVRVEDTGEEISLPPLDKISFGRLRDNEGVKANDVVITLPDDWRARLVSRWHFELRRRPDGFHLRPVSEQITEVDGETVAKGSDVPIKSGTVVRLGRGVLLTFLSKPTMSGGDSGDSTVIGSALLAPD